jgi:hypothetical protein
MISEELRQSQRYLVTLGRGRMGEQFLYEELSKRLEGSGLAVRIATEDDHRVPFDLEVLDEDRILVGIENKDLAPTTQGTWIKKDSKRSKTIYAEENHIRLILTTVTRRDIKAIGFREGLINGHSLTFDYSPKRLVKRILAARREDSTIFMLLGWDPREIVWLTKRIRSRLLAFGRLIIKAPCRLVDRLVNSSKFKDPRYARINGRWVKVDNTDELIGQLEELQQEVSR